MLNKLKLQHRILLGFLVPIVLLAGLIVLLILGNLNLQVLAQQLAAQDVIESVEEMVLKTAVITQLTLEQTLHPDESFTTEFNQEKIAFQNHLQDIKTLTQNTDFQNNTNNSIGQQLQDLITQSDTWLASLNRYTTTLESDPEAATAILESELLPQSRQLQEQMQQFLQTEQNAINQAQESASNNINTITNIVIIGAFVILLISLGTGWLISRGSSHTIQNAINAIVTSVAEIATTVEEYEKAASQQAAAVNETTTTMDELGVSSRQSAEQVEAATATARHALSLAEDGSKTVRVTLDEMSDLKDKVGAIADQILQLSEQIGQISTITNLVSDLANQTNMLALNAAVEAARAGEHGKGFAVVASEIRKLADMSKESAEQIHELVADIQQATNTTVMVTEEGTKTVARGTKLLEETGNVFSNLAEAIDSNFESVQQIAFNVKQQASAIGQVVEAMASINAGAKETAVGIGQTKLGIEHLNETASQLRVLV